MNFEERIVFPATRIISLLAIILLCVFAVYGLTMIVSLDPGTSVSYQSLKGKPAPTASTTKEQDALDGIFQPDNVKKYVGNDKNIKILQAWMVQVPQSQRQDFLDNMSQVISAAEANNDNVINVINNYKSEKLKKIAGYESEKLINKGKQFAGIMVIMNAFVLAVMFSMVLVLLAIERRVRGQITPNHDLPNKESASV